MQVEPERRTTTGARCCFLVLFLKEAANKMLEEIWNNTNSKDNNQQFFPQVIYSYLQVPKGTLKKLKNQRILK